MTDEATTIGSITLDDGRELDVELLRDEVTLRSGDDVVGIAYWAHSRLVDATLSLDQEAAAGVLADVEEALLRRASRRPCVWRVECPGCRAMVCPRRPKRDRDRLRCPACEAPFEDVDLSATWLLDDRVDGQAWRAYYGGRLATLARAADEAMEEAARENLRRLDELWEAELALRDLAAAIKPGSKDQVWLAIFSFLSVELENARCRRGGRYDAQVRQRGQRAARFPSYRAALAVGAQHVELGAGGSTMAAPAAPSKFSLPGGVRFNEIAVSPTRSGAARARNETSLLDVMDVLAAIRGARIGRDVDAETGRVVHEGRPLTKVEQVLIWAMDHGEYRRAGKAWELERLDADEAFRRLRQAKLDGADGPAPSTVRELRGVLGNARRAVIRSMQDRGLIPAEERRRPLPRPTKPALRTAPVVGRRPVPLLGAAR